MIKKIVDISERAYISVNQAQLVIKKEEGIVATIPVEDIGVLILQHPAITVTQTAIISCQQNNTIIVFCDERHLPYSVILPVSDAHSLHTKELQQQINTSKTVKKRLWQQIVRQKIKEQANTLTLSRKNPIAVKKMISKVKSGDTENHEAQASQIYWKLLYGQQFRRNRDMDGINSLLNYGYSIIRSLVARAIVGSGLHPAIGVHHHNQYNGLCLADDIMEPFRPWIDFKVTNFIDNYDDIEVNTESKQILLGILAEEVIYKDKKMPFMIASHYLMADFKRCMQDRSQKLIYPQLSSRFIE